MEEIIKTIKKEFRANMNGVASQYMRERGLGYHINFGIELPRLRTIASEYAPNLQLAMRLWQENVRESKIVAAMLVPIEEYDRSMADLWVEQIPNPEIAQTTVHNLLARLPYASDIAFEWIASEREMKQLCGMLIMARLLMQGGELNPRAEQEYLDQCEAVVRAYMDKLKDKRKDDVITQPLLKATVNALGYYGDLGEEQTRKVERILALLAE